MYGLPDHWQFREGTHDAEIARCVIECDEYRLRERKFSTDDVVVDVGAHIGCFSWLALQCGAPLVIAVEPWLPNWELLKANVADTRCLPINRACWRSDRRKQTLHYTPSADPANTGGGDVLTSRHGETCRTVPLDSLIADRQIRLLKLDCEGAEFPILLTSRKLHQIDEIAGEYHEMGEGTFRGDAWPIPPWAQVPGVESFTRDVLREHLEMHGFEVEVNHEAEHIGKFFAKRKA